MPVYRAKDKTLQIPDTREEWVEDFTFIQAADCQLGMEWTCMQTAVQNETDVECNWLLYYDKATWEHEIRWCTSFVNMLNKMQPRPKFAIMCGDILDAWPQKWPQVRDKQYIDFQRIFKELDIPLVCVCGNHDVGNSPTPETVEKYRSDFGDDWFTFVCNGVFCIVINSQYYEDPQYVSDIAAEHDKWLNEQLEIAKSEKYKHAVVFQHIPLFLKTPDEPKMYFNFSPVLRESLLKKFSDAGISKVFCGHYHRNAGGWYNDKMELIVTSAIGAQLGSDKNGFRIVSVSASEISHEYVELEDINCPDL